MRATRAAAWLTLLLAVCVAPAALAAPADVDRGFGYFGRALPPGSGPVTDLVTLRDGAVAGVSGASSGPGAYFGSVFRLSRDGFVDTTFRSTGSATFSGAVSSGSARADSLIAQPDGGLVVLGGNPERRPRFAVVRYLPDGRVDSAFGGGAGRIESDAVTPIAIAGQPDGSFVVAVASCSAASCRTSLVRYTANGARDPRFGANGSVRVPFTAAALAIGRHDRPVVLGLMGANEFGLARFRGDGTPDTTFGSGGLATVPRPSGFQLVPDALVVQSDGRVLTAAFERRSSGTRSWIVRYRANGALDTGFGVRGAARVSDMEITAIAREGSGKLVAVGRADMGAAFGLVRLRADGSRDRGFGRRGRALVDLDPEYNLDQEPFAIALGPHRRITVGGGLGFPRLDPVVVRFRGGASSTGPTAGRARYVVRLAHRGGRSGAFHRGDTALIRLADRLGRTQRYDVCWLPPPGGRGSCANARRTGHSVVRLRLAQAGHWTLRFRLQATGEVVAHTLRVFA